MKRWEVEHEGHVIRVENWFTRERLYVDDKLQDESVGGIIGTTVLWGHLSGEGQTRLSLKVRLGGVWGVGCAIFADDELVFTTHGQKPLS